MQVLVTGGTGFLGAYIIRYLLQAGLKVRATYRKRSDFSLVEDVREQVEWVETDLHDPDGLDEACAGVEQVFHVAALISFKKCHRDKMREINAAGTANVVNAALSNGVKKFLYVGSVAALSSLSNTEIDETVKWEKRKTNSAYGLSKHLGEKEVWRGEAEGLEVVIVHPSVIIGAGFWKAGTARMFHNAYNKLKFYPTGINGFVDVRDVAEMSIALMQSDIKGERFLLSSENMAYKDLLSMMNEAFGNPPPTISTGKGLLGIVHKAQQIRTFFTRKQPLFSKEMIHYMTEPFYFKNEKVLKTLPRQFTPIEQTVRVTAEAYLKSKEKNQKSAILPLQDLSFWMPGKQELAKQK